MKPFGLKVEVIVVTFAIFFLAIFLGQMLLNHYSVTRPLLKTLNNMDLIDYEMGNAKLTLVWNGKNIKQIVDLIGKTQVKKRFDEVLLILKVNSDMHLWQEEELIVKEGIDTKQYYTVLERLKKLDKQAEVMIMEKDYLYVSFLDHGQLYALRDSNENPIRLTSKVVFADE